MLGFAIDPFFMRIKMNNEKNRVLGRVLAVEETSAVAGARPTSVRADSHIDTSGNQDTAPTQDSGTTADMTNTIIDFVTAP